MEFSKIKIDVYFPIIKACHLWIELTTFALLTLEEKIRKNANQNESHCT